MAGKNYISYAALEAENESLRATLKAQRAEIADLKAKVAALSRVEIKGADLKLTVAYDVHGIAK